MSIRLRSQYDKRGLLAARAHRWRNLRASFRSPERQLSRVIALEPEFRELPDAALRERSDRWRTRLGEEPAQFETELADIIALLREISRRSTGLFPYPEQCLAALVLSRGAIAEQATGEGKTLTVLLAGTAFALAGQGVHVVTVNDYLARRDFDFARPMIDFLGLEGAFLDGDASVEEKRAIYRADVVYGTGYDFGFDYLRDQLAMMAHPRPSPTERLCSLLAERPTESPLLMHRRLDRAIVDEVDSVLIDEAESPLVISQSVAAREFSPVPYEQARQIALDLVEQEDFVFDRGRSAILTRSGSRRVHGAPGVPWEQLRRPWKSYVTNALTAKHRLQRDSHYIVQDDAIVIVDEFTGRAHAERSWNDGLHQAVEAEENVTIKPENEAAASITRQRLFTRHRQVCGLTGTASESAGEFWHFYKLPVFQIPLHRPLQRVIEPERVFKTIEHRDAAVLEEIDECRAAGQPVLIGTRTIQASESISRRLEERGIPHQLLTAKQNEQESEIIAAAGAPGSVVIATNMAGRGTHIDLTDAAIENGGLHVIVVERNDSVRIDRQLVGRGARQGEPGSARSFVSGEDDLVLRFGKDLATRLAAAPADEKGEVSSRFSEQFDRLQHARERQKYENRMAMAERDKWNDQTRESLS